MRIGVYGGSFDPVHRGHLLLADCCREQARLDRIVFTPARMQPLKPRGPVASGEDRLAMLRLAIADRTGLEASAAELDRQGVSYTVDTLRELARQYAGEELFLLLGADAAADVGSWKDPRAICELACPIVIERAGDSGVATQIATRESALRAIAPFASAERLAQARSLRVEMPPTPVSSSEIRRLIAAGGDWAPLVPELVAAYIREHGLYGASR
jgi:nicotinate-nucleotide adenylyltransferase